MKYYIKTYGCQMNVHESEKLAGVLESKGYSVATSVEEADVIVFNTCAIRESAEQKIMGNIGALKSMKARHKDKIIAICGCMSQEEGMPEKLKAKFPFIDIIFGTLNIEDFAELLDKRVKEKKSIIQIASKSNIKKRDSMHVYRTSGVNAWVNIMYGCNNFCTYCIVPYVRGREISRDIEVIVKEVAELVGLGYKQITLLGQNVNSYGNDIDDPSVNFANLLRRIDAIDGQFWVRFMSSHPKDISHEVIDVIANSKHICHGLHLPVQSGSNEILRKMNRHYTREKYFSIIDYARKKIPDIEFTTDIIVGFPGETKQDYNDTLDLVQKVGYQNIFAFMYSRRTGTVADKMSDQIPINIKRKRIKKLLDLERDIASDISEKYVGKVLKVLVEDVSPKAEGVMIGSLNSGKAVSFYGDKSLQGRFVDIKITKSKLTTLFGELDKK